jgi:hypothetical protein
MRYPTAIDVLLSYLVPIFPMNGVHAITEMSKVLYNKEVGCEAKMGVINRPGLMLIIITLKLGRSPLRIYCYDTF